MSSNLFAPITKLNLSHVSQVKPDSTDLFILEMDVQKRGVPFGREPLIATACSDMSIRFFSRESLEAVGTYSGHSARITGVKFVRKNPALCYSSSLDGTVRCWDSRMKGNRAPLMFTGYDGCSFTSFDLNCDEDVICSGTQLVEEDAYLMFWDVRSTNLLGAYKDSHSDDITQVKFHPNKGNSLATGSTDGLVCLFDIGKTNEDEALITTLNSESSVSRIGWCGTNNEYLYCLTHIESLIIWDAVESSILTKFTGIKESVKQDDCDVDFLVDCFYHTSLKSLIIVAGSRSGDLNLLSVGRDRLHAIHPLHGAHSAPVRCIHWDSQNEVLVTAGEDSIISSWRKSSSDNPILLSEEEIAILQKDKANDNDSPNENMSDNTTLQAPLK